MPIIFDRRLCEMLLVSLLFALSLFQNIENASVAKDSRQERFEVKNLKNGSFIIIGPTTPLTSSRENDSMSANFAKHRMYNQSNELSDRVGSDSILRPQLAVQIFTSPTNQEGKQLNGKPTIISSNQYQFDDRQQQTSPSARPANEKYPFETSSRLEPLRYETDSSSSSFSFRDSYAKPEYGVASANGSEGPIINAIINMPRNEHYQEHRHQDNSQTNNKLDLDDLNQTPTESVEHALSHLFENQANGNIEFSMNLNGDDIIINPMKRNNTQLMPSNNIRISTSEVTNRMAPKSFLRRARDGRRSESSQDQTISRALGRHIISELAGDEQSASEIDMVDGVNDDSDGNTDIESSSDGKDEMNRYKSKDIDAEIDKDRKSSALKHWPSSSNSASEPEINRNQPTGRESKNKSQKEKLFGTDDDEQKSLSNHWTNDREGNGDVVGSKRRSKFGARRDRNQAIARRKTLGGKRRPTFKTSTERDSSGNQSYDDHAHKSQATAPVVTINGEDVRRFERLLEDLRSLSLKNISEQKAKKLSKSSSKLSSVTLAQRSSNDENEDENHGMYSKLSDDRESSSSSGPPDDNSSLKPSMQTSRFSNNRRQNSPSGDASNDCDRRRNRQPKFDESNIVSEAELSPNMVDPDSSSSSDGTDELNDESSQNVEQEEHPNRLDTADSDRLQTNEADTGRSKDPQGEKPATLFVRKTVLKNYYDDDREGNNQTPDQVEDSSKSNDELESYHQNQHSYQHQKSTDDQSSTESDDRQPSEGQRGNDLRPHRELAGNPSPLNNYIDYSKLDNRDVYRGTESQKYMVSMLPRSEMDRMRSLQQVLEKAALVPSNQARS